jgi:Kdo2-lipid IVA lauroyltransferase/acyltransferase
MTEIGYSLAAELARRLPRSVLAPLIDLAVGAYVVSHPRRTRAVERNLARIWRARGASGARPRATETYRAFARALLEFAASGRVGADDRPLVRLSPEARDALALARNAGAPTVLVSGHFGSWERALQWISAEVGGVDAMAAPHRLEAVERFFVARRAAFGVRTLPNGGGTAAALRRLRSGGWIAALADRSSHAPTPIGGRGEPRSRGLVPVHPGPLLLAQRAGALVLPGVSWLDEDGSLGVRFQAPFTIAPARGGLTVPQALSRVQRFFDDHVRAHPTQWFDWGGARGAGLPG